MKKLLLSVAALGCFVSAQAQLWNPATANTPSELINRTGSVGLGLIPNSGVRLHISAAGNESGAIRVEQGKVSLGGASELTVDAPHIVGGRFTVKPSGNVGIGINDPSRKLEVFGGGTWLHHNNNGAAASVLDLGDGLNWAVPMFSLITADNGGSNTFKILSNREGSNYVWTRNYGGKDMVQIIGDATNEGTLLNIFDMANSSQTANVRLASNGVSFINGGNVGIGTTIPGSFKLAVEGKVGAREVVVTTAPWADYVFASNYKLRPLSEVERFIKANKHLPEVPTAVEIEKNGNSLAETDALLLKKIEELTLYVIEQNKQLQELKNENASLKKSIEAKK